MSTIGVLGVSAAEVRVRGQRIYPFMAALFLETAVAGFGPTSLALLATVESGQRPPLPLILHVHAVCMGTSGFDRMEPLGVKRSSISNEEI